MNALSEGFPGRICSITICRSSAQWWKTALVNSGTESRRQPWSPGRLCWNRQQWLISWVVSPVNRIKHEVHQPDVVRVRCLRHLNTDRKNPPLFDTTAQVIRIQTFRPFVVNYTALSFQHSMDTGWSVSFIGRGQFSLSCYQFCIIVAGRSMQIHQLTCVPFTQPQAR